MLIRSETNATRCEICHGDFSGTKFNHTDCLETKSLMLGSKVKFDQEKIEREGKRLLLEIQRDVEISPIAELSNFLRSYRQPLLFFLKHRFKVPTVNQEVLLADNIWSKNYGALAYLKEKKFLKYRIRKEVLNYRGGLIVLLNDSLDEALHVPRMRARVELLLRDFESAVGIPSLLLHSSKCEDRILFQSFNVKKLGQYFPELAQELLIGRWD